MNVELRRIAEKKLEQMGGDVCGVLVRKDGKLAAVDEHGRVQWLQGGQGAEPVAEVWPSHHFVHQNHVNWLVDVDDLPNDALLYLSSQPAQQGSDVEPLYAENEALRAQLTETEAKGRVLMDMCRDLKARVAELLTVCQAVQRDLLLRAEPDWDGSGQQVVNLSAGFWEELNRVIGTYDDTACKSFDAMILRKQAEAVDDIRKDLLSDLPLHHIAKQVDIRLGLRVDSLREKAEKAGGDK